MYLYCCTVHFEDSLNITHQQMHQSYIVYWSKIIYIKTLSLLLHVSIAIAYHHQGAHIVPS